MKKLALVTYARLPELAVDDRLLLPPLAEAGFSVQAVLWDDPTANWAAFSAVLLRSPWDYYRRPVEFQRWLARLEQVGVRVFNPLPTLRWNLQKDYLKRLAALGIGIVPTEWVLPGDRRTLRQVLEARGWSDAVVKPVFSAGGYLTWRAHLHAEKIEAPSVDEVLCDPYALEVAGSGAPTGLSVPADSEAASLWALTREAGELMVQPFVEEILEAGEHSFIFFGGEFSHAIVKRARAGEFRVQNEHGGTVMAVDPSASDILCAKRVLEAAASTGIAIPLYARVDMIRTRVGGWWLGELEMLEPSLYFGWGEGAAARFVAQLMQALGD